MSQTATPAGDATATPPPPSIDKWIALALLALAQFVVVLDASIVNVALPSIGRDLEFSQENLSWVVNAYTLAFGGFLLLGGRTGRPARPPAPVHGRPRSCSRSRRWPAASPRPRAS